MLEEFDAVYAQLGTGKLAGKTYDAARFDSQGKLVRAAYVILYGGTPDRLTDDRFTAEQRITSRAEYVYTVRAVAPDAAGARYSMAAAMANLIGFKPTIAGRKCTAIALSLAGEIRDDDSVTPPLFFVDSEFTFISAPA